jgi:hypothetical protein
VASHSTRVGIAVALAAAAGFALANTSANVAYHGGSNPLTVAATRFLVPMVADMRMGKNLVRLRNGDCFELPCFSRLCPSTMIDGPPCLDLSFRRTREY